MMKCLFALAVAMLLGGCVSDEAIETNAANPTTARGAWRGDTGLTGVGGTGTGGTGQAGAGISNIGIDRQRTTGTGTLTNQVERTQE